MEPPRKMELIDKATTLRDELVTFLDREQPLAAGRYEEARAAFDLYFELSKFIEQMGHQ